MEKENFNIPVEQIASETKEAIEVDGIEHMIAFEKVLDFAEAARESGGRALLVGGCVRDELMGIEPKDFDIEVYGIEAEQLRELANEFGAVNEVGEAFGILKVEADGFDLDISLPRRESSTGAGHRDFAVNADPFMSIEDAAWRRDFTMNAIAKDPLSGEIIDHFGAVEDIENGILRITDEERFRDDPLRVLRGVQFIGRFGLRTNEETAATIRDMSGELAHLPKERLREEWLKLLSKSSVPSLGLEVAREWGILETMHLEMAALAETPQEPEWHPEGDVWTHTKMVVDAAAKIVREENLEPREASVVMLAALCHDLGKPETTKVIDGRITSRGHEEAGVEPARQFLTQIGVEKSLQKQILPLVAEHLKPSVFHKDRDSLTDGAIKRLAGRVQPATLKQLAMVARADHLGRGPFPDEFTGELKMPEEYPAGEWLVAKAAELGVDKEKPEPVLFGRDLIARGFAPGPEFGKAIQAAEELHVKGWEREEILAFIEENSEKSLTEIIKIMEGEER